MLACGGFDSIVGGRGNDGAERLRVFGMTKAPQHFDLAMR